MDSGIVVGVSAGLGVGAGVELCLGLRLGLGSAPGVGVAPVAIWTTLAVGNVDSLGCKVIGSCGCLSLRHLRGRGSGSRSGSNFCFAPVSLEIPNLLSDSFLTATNQREHGSVILGS